VRWRLVVLVVVLAFITIVDRVCISSAKIRMAADLGIRYVQFGWIFGVFALGYAIAMIPGGWLVNRIGSRVFLTAIVCCWSLLTASTGLVSSLAALIIIRLLFGVAEAGVYPAANRALYRWMGASERASAVGLLNAGSRLGAALGLVIASSIILWLGWRPCFWLLGAVGLVWGTDVQSRQLVRAIAQSDEVLPGSGLYVIRSYPETTSNIGKHIATTRDLWKQNRWRTIF
jgi:MFS transporter, ACS family, glucarate transporter